MRKVTVIAVYALFACNLQSASLSFEGSYTTNWKSSTPYTFQGTLSSKSDTEYEGEVTAPWNGKIEKYVGTITGKVGGTLSGDFIMSSTKRHFKFTINPSGGNYRGEVLEGKSKVGVLDARVSGGAGGFSGGGGGVDYSELVSEAVSKTTSISKEQVLELFKNKGSKDDVIAVCAAAEVTKGDMTELLKKKKKVNTNYEFIKDLNLDKETKSDVDALIKKIKAEMEGGKKKK